MAKVWAVREGDRIRIDGHGFATVEQPCEVPAEVAAALVADMALAQAAGKPVRLAFEAPLLEATAGPLEPEQPAAEPEKQTEEQAPPAPARSKRGRATPQEE